jgi:hypothetical protein
MRCSMFFCFILAGMTTASAQQTVELNGQVGTFTPLQAQQNQGGYVTVQPRQGQQGGLPVCREIVLSDELQIERKMIERQTHVRVIEKTLPTERRAIQTAPPQNPCPPQDSCLQQRQGGGSPLPTWNSGGVMTYAQWCAQQNAWRAAQQRQQPQQQGLFSCLFRNPNLVSANAGVGVLGVGAAGSVRVGMDSGYGGYGYSTQPNGGR